MSCLRDMRKRWVPLIKIATTSGVDLWGDYTFYSKTALNGALDAYQLPLYVFLIIACVMTGLTVATLVCKGCCPNNAYVQKLKTGRGGGGDGMNEDGRRRSSSSSSSRSDTGGGGGCRPCDFFINRINQILSLEILVEDIPQLILTALITQELGVMTPAATFNITTSGFNFVFNILDMVDPTTSSIPSSVDDQGKKNDNYTNDNGELVQVVEA